MLDPNIFPELNGTIVQDWVLKVIEGYSFIEMVLLYRGMKVKSSHILVYMIPDKETLIKTEDQRYQAFHSFEAGFNTSADLYEAFRDATLDGSSCSCIDVEAVSEKDEALKPYVIDGSNHWVLYEKHPQGADDNKEIKTAQDIGKIGGLKNKRNVPSTLNRSSLVKLPSYSAEETGPSAQRQERALQLLLSNSS
jgi:hypothetical protein